MLTYAVKMIDEKRQLRTEVLKKRNTLPLPNRVLHSATILQRLFELEEIKSAHWIKFYASYGSEVETYGMMAHALSHGKRVAVPKVEGDDRLVFSEVLHPVRDLAPGWKGIPEPKAEALRPVKFEELNLIVIPGIAYDERGNRVGQGLGFYDRLLRKNSSRIPVVAVAFELQIVPEVPVSPHDIHVDLIVTEKRVIECRKT